MESVMIKRVYEPYKKSDGFRVLIDRLWPRGVKKEEAKVDVWLKEIAPSSTLRKWFNHEPEKWHEFIIKYKVELKESVAVEDLKSLIKKHKKITLIYAAHDMEHNNAVFLKDFISSHN